jgi:hypothetical protein
MDEKCKPREKKQFFYFYFCMNERREESGEKGVRTDLIYDGVELGLVPRGEEDVEARFGELNRKLASNAVRCARDN